MEWDVVCVDTGFSVGDECCERIRLYQAVECGDVGFFEYFWDVHGVFFPVRVRSDALSGWRC